MRAARGADGGQMLILAGAVLVLSFLLAAFSVTELTSQEIALEEGPEGRLATTFHETRAELATALGALTIPETTNTTLEQYVNAQRAEFEERGRAHGLFVIVDWAGVGEHGGSRASLSEKKDMTERGAASTCGGTDDYTVWSYDGSRKYTDMHWDCEDDGILYDVANQRIAGVALFMSMSSEAARVEETFVIKVN